MKITLPSVRVLGTGEYDPPSEGNKGKSTVTHSSGAPVRYADVYGVTPGEVIQLPLSEGVAVPVDEVCDLDLELRVGRTSNGNAVLKGRVLGASAQQPLASKSAPKAA